MSGFVPAFDWHRVVVQPWTADVAVTWWIVLMGFMAGLRVRLATPGGSEPDLRPIPRRRSEP